MIGSWLDPSRAPEREHPAIAHNRRTESGLNIRKSYSEEYTSDEDRPNEHQ